LEIALEVARVVDVALEQARAADEARALVVLHELGRQRRDLLRVRLLGLHDVLHAVIPGLIETPRTLDGANSLGPARAIRFLTSADARYITGQTLVVDGGMTVRSP
jgi:hypothetical protein